MWVPGTLMKFWEWVCEIHAVVASNGVTVLCDFAQYFESTQWTHLDRARANSMTAAMVASNKWGFIVPLSSGRSSKSLERHRIPADDMIIISFVQIFFFNFWDEHPFVPTLPGLALRSGQATTVESVERHVESWGRLRTQSAIHTVGRCSCLKL